jgi:hypothetical protein
MGENRKNFEKEEEIYIYMISRMSSTAFRFHFRVHSIYPKKKISIGSPQVEEQKIVY